MSLNISDTQYSICHYVIEFKIIHKSYLIKMYLFNYV